jgi:hypothetical protein
MIFIVAIIRKYTFICYMIALKIGAWDLATESNSASAILHFTVLLFEVQGCQVAVVTAPLLKSGRRKNFGAVKNSGP